MISAWVIAVSFLIPDSAFFCVGVNMVENGAFVNWQKACFLIDCPLWLVGDWVRFAEMGGNPKS
ncbi:MAG: hypothetical protein DRP66_08975 [Planctomycetota bacterium]|nr:MAG: hypothetical protein DRP66_08975 [Planctomycetota bacterium]